MTSNNGNRSHTRALVRGLALLVLLAAAGVYSRAMAHDDPASDGLIDGGGSTKTDCVAKFQTGLELNYPAGKPKELACTDGDIACDGDGVINGSCTFNVGLCLADDEDLLTCTPAAVPTGGVLVKNKASAPDPDLTSFQASIDTLLGAAGVPCDNPGAGGGNCLQCTAALTPIDVSLAVKGGRKKIVVKTTTSVNPSTGKVIKDSDKLPLRCLSCPDQSAFEHINRIIFQESGCAASTFCHTGATPQAGLNLDSNMIGVQGVYDELITEDPTTSGAVALGMRRIMRSDPDLDGTSSSLVLEKLRRKANELTDAYCTPNSLPNGCMGGGMPPGVDTFSTGKLDLLKTWIAAGAPFTGWPGGASCGNPEDIYTPAVPLDAPAAGQGFQVHMPAPAGFTLAPGTEFEGCQWIEVPSDVTQTMYIDRVEIRMNPGTHHLLVFSDIADSGPAATATAFDPHDALCNKQFGLKRSFAGSQDPSSDVSMPNGVSFAVQPGAVFGINVHYTNSYNVPIYPEVWINFWGSTSPTPKLQKGIFPGDVTFSIPRYEAGVGNVVTYTQGGTSGCFYSLTSHAHRRNIGFKMWSSDPTQGGTLTKEQAWDNPTGLFYYNTDWDHPTDLQPDPRMLMQPGQQIYFQCRWDNGGINPANIKRRCLPNFGSACDSDYVCTTNADCGAGTQGVCLDCPLTFGFLAEDEMCFLPGFYYDADPGPSCPY